MYLTKEELIEKRKALEAIIPTIAMEIEQVPEIFHNPKDKKNGAERLDWAYSHTIYQKISRAARSGTGNQSQTLKLHPTVKSILHEILTVNNTFPSENPNWFTKPR